MRAVVQRVRGASLLVDGVVRAGVPEGSPGLVVLAGLFESDGETERAWLADKIVNLRIFPDTDGKMNRSVSDVEGTIMLVPNFTLAGEAERGRRPSFDRAMKPPRAEDEFAALARAVRLLHPRTVEGVFRAHMHVTLTNDGPVTIVLESPNRSPAN